MSFMTSYDVASNIRQYPRLPREPNHQATVGTRQSNETHQGVRITYHLTLLLVSR
jgi:hypothetical protein